MVECGVEFKMDDQVALVTGGASGIGAAIVKMLAASGASVVVIDRDEEGASELVQQLGRRAASVTCDVTDVEAVGRAVEEAVGLFGGVDLLVNCAGVVALGPSETLAVGEWDRVVAVNLRGTFLMSQAVGRLMLARGRGRIVNIASQAASVGLEGHAAYCASKAGVVALTRVMALEWGPRGITVNAVSPTVVMTDLGRLAWEGERGEKMRALIPTRRFAEPDEVAAAVLFLCTGAAAMVNGVDLLVDGGYTAQ